MLTAVVFDDERPALKFLSIQLESINKTKIIGQFINCDELMKCIVETMPDIAFLDIEAPSKNGLEVASEINKISPLTAIVFVTAYKKYAYEAFGLEAVDYLLKPVKRDRLERVIQKIIDAKTFMNKMDESSNEDRYKIEVHTMNQFSVYDLEGNPVRFRTTKTRELMAFLIHHHGEKLTSDIIIEALWPDKESKKAKGLLYTTRYYLKKALFPLGITSIQHDYLIRTADIKGDFIEIEKIFERLEARNISTNIFDEEVKAFIQLSRYYTGRYFEKNSYDWANFQQINYERRYVYITEIFEEYYENNNQIKLQIDLLERLVHMNEFNEDYYYKLIKIYKEINDFDNLERIKEKYNKIQQ